MSGNTINISRTTEKIHEQLELLETAMRKRQEHILREKDRLTIQYRNIQHQFAKFQDAQIERMDVFEKKPVKQ